MSQVPKRTPTWGEIEAFCQIDGWIQERTTKHVFWRKTLPSGEVLETHRSLAANKSMSHDVFGVILRSQLKVSRADFWRALETGEPVVRPSDEADPEPQIETWVFFGLLKQGLTEEEIRALAPEDARRLLHERWATPPD